MELPNAEEIFEQKLKEWIYETYGKDAADKFKMMGDHSYCTRAMHEYARRVLDVAADEAKVDEFFDQRDCSTRAFVDKSSILRLKELLK